MSSTSTNYARPWLRLNLGMAIPTPGVKPFFGVEGDLALVSKSVDINSSNEDMLKGLAPKSQIGVYAGIRF